MQLWKLQDLRGPTSKHRENSLERSLKNNLRKSPQTEGPESLDWKDAQERDENKHTRHIIAKF